MKTIAIIDIIIGILCACACIYDIAIGQYILAILQFLCVIADLTLGVLTYIVGKEC